MEIEKIRNYISYFETVNAETACRWEVSRKLENGTFSMPYPVYETQFLNFIDDVSTATLWMLTMEVHWKNMGLK